MRSLNGFFILSLLIGAAIITGCSDETPALKQKIAELEKKLEKQEKDLREFAGKFAPPKDFSADIQRIEDQQEKVTQALQTKVEPVNSKLEEFRDWAQEAQKERESTNQKLKALEQQLGELQKRAEAEVSRGQKESAAAKKSIATLSKGVEDLSKGLNDVRKEILDNNTKLVNAVKKTLPKVKDAAVAELKDRLAPLEQKVGTLKTAQEGEHKPVEQPPKAPPPPAVPDAGKEVQALAARVKEMEEIVTTQKAYLLEMGAKVHEIETYLRRN